MRARTALLATAAVVGIGYFLYSRKASAAPKPIAPGYGEPGFVAPATPAAPVSVIGCSFARAGNQLIDVNTGKVITELEAVQRAKKEGCTVPGMPVVIGREGPAFARTNVFA